MKTYNFTSKDDENKAVYWATADHDLVDNRDEAIDDYNDEPVAKIIVHGFFVGSLDDMRKNAKRLYDEARNL